MLASLLASQAMAADFELRDGDRVVFLGDGLIEQEQYFGWVELMMSTAYPDRNITFRNLGWNADTPRGASRFGLSLLQAGHESSSEGFKQLVKQLELTRPTVIVFGYGLASAMEGGPEGLDQFIKDYNELTKAAQDASPGVRYVFLSPLTPLSRENPHRRVVASYSKAIAEFAYGRNSPFVDLSDVATSPGERKDDIHLNSEGYRDLADAVRHALKLPESGWKVNPHSAMLREIILRKNQWWFHRSRPANVAYVFGFRKREQGQNAVEIPKFDELVAQDEEKIRSLRKLQPVALQEPEPQLESKYARFTEQPIPEFTVGKDLEVSLWAANPQLNKPIQINFDPQGRLWVASSEAYPMIEVGQSPPDKILVLEDSNGDGKADKSTVFAEGLLIPTGVEPGDGGVYVAQSTDLLFLKDTDGDGKADLKRRVQSGFGTEDTHHNLHTLRWGPDGRLYMNQSVYTRTDTETPHGVVRLKAGGGFRYHTNSQRMQIFFRGLWNSWGHQFDAFGQSFMTDGAGFAGIAYVFPGATFAPTPRSRKQLDLISPGRYPKFCSADIIYGDSYPQQWQGSIVTCDFRANRVTRFSLSEQGAGFVTKQEDDLLRTSAATFRPIDVKQGPDGALYIADWSNPIINHGEVDFRDERRDRWHGRIWRVSWKGAEKKPITDLTKLSTEQLLDNLKSDDRYTRDQSRRVLIDRRSETSSALKSWSRKQTDGQALLQALWLGQAVDVSQRALLSKLLYANDHRVRAAAVRVLSDWCDPASEVDKPIGVAAALLMLRPRIHDEHPRVRLEAIRGLANLGSAKAASVALEALDHDRDRFLDYALYLTINAASDRFMNQLEMGSWTPDTPAKAKQLEFVLTAIEPARASQYLTKHLAANRIPKDGSGPWIGLIGKAGGPGELKMLFDQVKAGGFDSGATVRAMDALYDAGRLRKISPAGGPAGIGQLLAANDPAVKMAATRLAGIWRLGGQIGNLMKIASDNGEALPIRSSAIDALRTIGGGGAVAELKKLTGAEYSLPIRKLAVASLAALGPNEAAQPFFAVLAEIKTEDEGLDLWRGMLSGKDAAQTLIANMPDNLSKPAALSGLRVAREGGRREPELVAALMPHTGLSITAQKMTPERIKEMIGLVSSQGDPHRGETVYRRTELACVTCHAIGGVGGKVGPDMTSLGASAPVDYIIESLYDPNAKIKENYHSVIVATEEGQVLTGVQVSSTDEEFVIRDATDKLIRIPAAEVVDTKNGKSLMPTGVIDRLDQKDQIDLITFLTRLGKPGDFDASKGGVARIYEVFAGTHRMEQQGADRITSGAITEGWQPLTARVNGSVPGSTLAELTTPPANISLVNVYLRTHIEAASDGPVTFSVDGTDQAALWVDGQAIDGKKTDLKAGKHTVVVRLDARGLPDQFKLHSRDVSFAVQ